MLIFDRIQSAGEEGFGPRSICTVVSLLTSSQSSASLGTSQVQGHGRREPGGRGRGHPSRSMEVNMRDPDRIGK